MWTSALLILVARPFLPKHQRLATRQLLSPSTPRVADRRGIAFTSSSSSSSLTSSSASLLRLQRRQGVARQSLSRLLLEWRCSCITALILHLASSGLPECLLEKRLPRETGRSQDGDKSHSSARQGLLSLRRRPSSPASCVHTSLQLENYKSVLFFPVD